MCAVLCVVFWHLRRFLRGGESVYSEESGGHVLLDVVGNLPDGVLSCL